METIKQIKSAHRADPRAISLKAFAREKGVLAVITKAHRLARPARSEAKRLRTQAATACNRAGRRKRSKAHN